MIDPDQLMKDMAEAIVEDGIYPEEYINDNGIMAKKIDS